MEGEYRTLIARISRDAIRKDDLGFFRLLVEGWSTGVQDRNNSPSQFIQWLKNTGRLSIKNLGVLIGCLEHIDQNVYANELKKFDAKYNTQTSSSSSNYLRNNTSGSYNDLSMGRGIKYFEYRGTTDFAKTNVAMNLDGYSSMMSSSLLYSILIDILYGANTNQNIKVSEVLNKYPWMDSVVHLAISDQNINVNYQKLKIDGAVYKDIINKLILKLPVEKILGVTDLIQLISSHVNLFTKLKAKLIEMRIIGFSDNFPVNTAIEYTKTYSEYKLHFLKVLKEYLIKIPFYINSDDAWEDYVAHKSNFQSVVVIPKSTETWIDKFLSNVRLEQNSKILFGKYLLEGGYEEEDLSSFNRDYIEIIQKVLKDTKFPERDTIRIITACKGYHNK